MAGPDFAGPQPLAAVLAAGPQRRREPVTVGKDRLTKRPLDGQLRVVPRDRDVQGGGVRGFYLVADIGEGAKHLQAVRASGRYPELEVRRVVQDEAAPLQEGGRPWAQVNHHVEYLAARRPDQLRLAQLAPGVQPAEHAPAGTRVVLLN